MAGDAAAEREAEKRRVQSRLHDLEQQREREAKAKEEEELRLRRERHREEKARVLARLAEKEAKDTEAKDVEERRRQQEAAQQPRHPSQSFRRCLLRRCQAVA
jgi:hypothetical protein